MSTVRSLFPALWRGLMVIFPPNVHRGVSPDEFSSLQLGGAVAESRELSFDI